MLCSKFFNTNNTYFNHTALRSNSINEDEGYPVATNFRAKTLYKVGASGNNATLPEEEIKMNCLFKIFISPT